MGELLIGFYTHNIHFIYKGKTLIVGTEWDCTDKFNSIDYKNISNGKWIVTHFYNGVKEIEEFNQAQDVIDFFVEQEQSTSKYNVGMQIASN